jgi:hypothetical protein
MLPLLLAAFIEFGIYPVDFVAQYTPSFERLTEQGSGYLTFGGSAHWYGFFVEGEVRTDILKSYQLINFIPVGMSYSIGGGWKNDWIEIGWEHECSHPVVTYYPVFPGTFNWEGAIEHAYVRISMGEH